MLEYILVAVLVFAFSFLDLIKISWVNARILLVILFIVLWLFLGTRSVGPDLWTYNSFYILVPPFPSLFSVFGEQLRLTLFEPGFLLLIGLCKFLGLNFNVFNLICSFFILYFTFKRLNKYSVGVFISVLIYLAYGYIYAFSVIRQVLAASIFFYSLEYLLQDKKWKYALGVLMACLFHYSAVILFVFSFINKQRFSSKFIILILTVFLLALYSNILRLGANAILTLVPFFSPTKINQYLAEDGDFLGSVSIVWMAILGICLCYRHKLEKFDARFNLYLNILWVGLAIYIISVGFGGFGRVLLYFKLVYTLILPLFVVLIKERIGRFLAVIVIAVMSFALYFASILTDTDYAIVNRYLPYRSWLFKIESDE